MAINERVFKSKRVSTSFNTDVTLLMDFSGSMEGTKVIQAIKSALLLNASVSVLNIPLEILGFTTSGPKDCKHMIFKHSHQRISEEKLALSLCDAATNMYNNNDAVAVLWAYDRLMQRNNSHRKVLIVLSDGSPAAYSDFDVADGLLSVTRMIEQQSDVELYGIGIEDDNVEHFYKNHAVLNDSSELETTLLNVVKSKILNKGN